MLGSRCLSLGLSLSLYAVLLRCLSRSSSSQLLDLGILLLDLLHNGLVEVLEGLFALLRLLKLLDQCVLLGGASLDGCLKSGKLGLNRCSLLFLSLTGGNGRVNSRSAGCSLLLCLLGLLLREFEGLGGFDQLAVALLLELLDGLGGFGGLVAQ